MVSSKAEPVLRELGERGDIIKAMHRALQRQGLAEDRHPAGYVVHRENATERITGRVLDKGLGGDEMGERVRLVIDGVDGRVHHVEMDAARAEEVGRGMIVVAGSAPPRPARRGSATSWTSPGRGRCLSPVRASGTATSRPRPYRRRSRGLRSLPRSPAGGATPGRPCRADRRRSLARPRRSPRAWSGLRSCAGPREYPNKRPVSYRPRQPDWPRRRDLARPGTGLAQPYHACQYWVRPGGY